MISASPQTDYIDHMTDWLPEKREKRSFSAESIPDLQQHINHSTELNALLDRFGDEIEKLGLVDGYLINLRDSDTEHLISLKVHLTAEFHVLEQTYYRYKVALSGDALNLNARAFHSRGIVQCDSDNGTDIEKNLLKLWKLQEIAAIAILDDDDFSQAPIGTLLLLKQGGRIDEHIFVAIEKLISVFYKPLRVALENSFLQEPSDHIESAPPEKSWFQQFSAEMNNLTSTETIYQMFATEMFRQFAFDGVGFFLLENDLLLNKRVEAADPHYQDISEAWEKYLLGNPYILDTTDGGISHTFLKNLPLIFHDVQTIINLPMSEKDRHALNILRTPRTLLLVPICYKQNPIGVLAFYSLLEPVNVSESDLHLIRNLASFFGAAIIDLSRHAIAGDQIGA
jgi:hypothetical protein